LRASRGRHSISPALVVHLNRGSDLFGSGVNALTEKIGNIGGMGNQGKKKET
jgi:hypothetical protein